MQILLILEFKIRFAGTATTAINGKGRLVVAIALEMLHGSCNTFDIRRTITGPWTEGTVFHFPFQLMLLFHCSSLCFSTFQTFVMLQKKRKTFRLLKVSQGLIEPSRDDLLIKVGLVWLGWIYYL